MAIVDDWPSPIGSKFNTDGSLRPFAGNTVICHITADNPAFKVIAELQGRIADCSWRDKIALLPPESFHMTVFEGICDQVRVPDRWPKSLPLTATLPQCHDFFARRLREFDWDPPDSDDAAVFEVEIETLASHPSIWLQPASSAQNALLRGLRDQLADLLELRAPDHDRYGFHLTLGYPLLPLDAAEKQQAAALLDQCCAVLQAQLPVIQLGRPEFCHFDDMGHFARQFYL